MAEIILANLNDINGFASNTVTLTGTTYGATSQGIYLVNQSGPFTFTLPNSSQVTAGSFVLVKDVAGQAFTWPITIQPSSGTIDGAATQVINSVYGEMWFVWTGSAWSVFDKYINGPKIRISGNATLIAGAKEVDNPYVSAGSVVMLTYYVTAGTPGRLSYVLTPGASFTINSSSNTDTSQVSYVLFDQA